MSFIIDKKKTGKALRIALKKCIKILPVFLTMLIFVSFVLYLIPDEVISRYLGNRNMFSAFVSASVLGSISIMPGFIVYPLCGILLKKHVAYMVLSAFSTTLMMVGVLTYPVEKAYFGMRVTVIRNCISLVIAVIVALVTGLFFGELL